MDLRRDCDVTVQEQPFVPCSRNEASFLLCSSLSYSRDLDDNFVPAMIVIRQIHDQPLETAPHNKKNEMTVLLCPSHHIEGREVFDLAGLRGEHVTMGLEA